MQQVQYPMPPQQMQPMQHTMAQPKAGWQQRDGWHPRGTNTAQCFKTGLPAKDCFCPDGWCARVGLQVV